MRRDNNKKKEDRSKGRKMKNKEKKDLKNRKNSF